MAQDQTLSDTVASSIRAHRERLGLSRDELAERCAGHGRPELSSAAIINIETGRRNADTGQRRREISIDELVVFEKALGVRLFSPRPPCGTCQDSPPAGFACRTCGAEA